MAYIELEPKAVRACIARAPLRFIVDVDNEKFWNRAARGDILSFEGIVFVVVRTFKDGGYKPLVGTPYLVEATLGSSSLRGLTNALQYFEENGVDLRLPSEFL